jgi:hypothetical protein
MIVDSDGTHIDEAMQSIVHLAECTDKCSLLVKCSTVDHHEEFSKIRGILRDSAAVGCRSSMLNCVN